MAHVAYQDAPKTAYLRHRPFLIVELYKTVASTSGHNRTRTEKKGWMNDPRNIETEEVPSVVDSVKEKHMRRASVIIDILRDRVVKNRLQENADTVLTHYKRKYANVIERGKSAYHQQVAKARNFDAFKQSVMRDHGAQMHDAHTPDVARAVSRKV